MLQTISHLPEIIRGFERVLVVVGGIISVYLGFRLFHIAHIAEESEGKFKASIFEFTFSRVGPGVFFALFGAWILYTSLTARGLFSGPDGYITAVSGEAPPRPEAQPLRGSDSSAALNAFANLKERLSKLPAGLQEKAQTDMNTIEKSIAAARQNELDDALESLDKQIMNLPETERESARMALMTIRSFFGEPDPYYRDSAPQRGIRNVPVPVPPR